MEEVSFVSKIFWSVDKANAELEAGTMNSKTKFRYYFIFALLTAFFIEIPSLLVSASDANNVNIYDTLLSVLIVLMAIFIPLYFFKHYKGSASFIEKIIILGIAILPRLILWTILPLIVFIGVYVFFYPETTETTFLEFSVSVLFSLLPYYLLSKYFLSTPVVEEKTVQSTEV